MRRIIIGIVATIVIATSVSAQHQLPYGSRVGMNITVVRSGGVGSQTAFAEIVHTRENAREFCTNYLNDNSQKCVEENLSVGVKGRISANCVNGTFYDAFGVRFQFRGPNLNKSDQNDTDYIIFNYSDNAALCSAAACGYDERLITFAFLCPNRVSLAKIDKSQSPQSTVWNHNGSTVALVTYETSRFFIYEVPRKGITEQGVESGDLLFSGTVIGTRYSGTAYIFRRGCVPAPYAVSGTITDGQRRVILRGQAPRLTADCHIIGHFSDQLVFDSVGTRKVENNSPTWGSVLDATGLFIVTKAGIFDRSDAKAFVRIGERVSLDDLRRRFKSYDFEIQTRNNENCAGTCIYIESGFLRLVVHDAGSKGFVSLIECRMGCVDRMGHSIGDPVTRHLADLSECADAEGKDVICAKKDDLMHYEFRSEGADCELTGRRGATLPSCAKISAFRVYVEPWIAR